MRIWAKSITFIAISTALIVSSADAQRYNERLLLRKGAWTVSLTHETHDGSLWCNAETTNRRGQTLSITAYPSNSLTLFFFDHSWNIAKRHIRFLVDIDYSRWTIDGTGDGISISVQMNEAENAFKFLEEVMLGNAVALMNADERRLAVFSLNGSSAAVRTLFECWKSISIDPDPFRTDADPFGANIDPF